MKPLFVVIPAILVAAVAGRVIATELPATPTRAVAAPSKDIAPSAPQAPFTASLRARTLQLSRMPIALAASATAAQSADRLIARAGTSTLAERETVRATIAKAAANPEFVAALGERAFSLRERDYSAALTALSLLGETRAPAAQERLLKFTAIPLPTQGHVIDGLIAERTTLEQLQMKAVQGLAYARTPAGDQNVLKLAASHESRNVRAEAIEAYLYNHQYSPEARKALEGVVKPEDRVYLDRPHLLPTTAAADFNAQLERYLKLHPEAVAPAPQHLKADTALAERDKTKDATRPVRPIVTRAAQILSAPPDRQ